ncbi:pectinesterase family protein [Mucilaginibacter rubeus]|uniref:Pectinesterase n=1 Tax=Mucilaginibacter rubeus TaxID=2027860 RepID=A0A5C1HUQ0_9SPHI|nr:pectinesterase family protein [Mucilaginibacter rubeus]QEM08861.1 pectin esterase [Mucilaginibacter rubeus]
MKRAALLMWIVFVPALLLAQAVTYPNHFTVAQDGSCDFKTIQQAVNAVRDLSQQRVVINIKAGIYQEKLVIPSWKCNIELLGEDQNKTIVINSDFSGKPNPQGKDAFAKAEFTTYTSYTVLAQGNDFIARNLTIANAAGPVGQAVALHVEGDRCAVINCRLLGNQDTVYAGTENSRQFYKDCYIEGTTDFIFGEATAVFQNCVIRSLKNSFITAPATTARQQFGFVFLSCKLIPADTAVKKVFLGRPWRPYAKSVFINTQMDTHISATGWDNWRNPENEKTAFFAEYKSKGTDISKRAPWSHQLTDAEAKKYTLNNILAGNDKWDVTLIK